MHTEGEKFLNVAPENTFPGISLPPEAHHIKVLVERSGALSVLDYGSGKGQQYDARNVKLATGEVVETIVDYWGIDYVHCYDPSYAKYSTLPLGPFDGVICTDVLEHCPEDDLPWIVAEIFAYAEKFVYANVACYPAMKRLPTGENAHCTVRAPEWWLDLFRGVASKFPGVMWELSAHVLIRDGSGRSVEERFHSSEVSA